MKKLLFLGLTISSCFAGVTEDLEVNKNAILNDQRLAIKFYENQLNQIVLKNEAKILCDFMFENPEKLWGVSGMFEAVCRDLELLKDGESILKQYGRLLFQRRLWDTPTDGRL